MTGSGNDFVFLDGRFQSLADWPAERIRATCDRRRGVGADGLVFLNPLAPGRAQMIYFNADGSRAEMCGNAALCSAQLVDRLGMAPGVRIDLETDSGLLECRTVGSGWAAELRFPTAPIPQPFDLAPASGERRAFYGVVGVPHVVIVVDDLEAVDVEHRGRQVRLDPAFAPRGTNVNFVGPTESLELPWAMRTYERGVENETLGCGTGTIVTALALAGAGLAPLPVRIRSRSGSPYSVSATINGDSATDVWLAGEARLVFSGHLES